MEIQICILLILGAQSGSSVFGPLMLSIFEDVLKVQEACMHPSPSYNQPLRFG